MSRNLLMEETEQEEFFSSLDLGDGIIRISGSGSVFCYLVLGREVAALLDTMTGLGNLRHYVETLTDLPIEVFNTHAHLDHIGGNFSFDYVHVPRKDLKLYPKHTSRKLRFDFERSFVKEPMKWKYSIEDMEEEREISLLPVEDGDVFSLGERELIAVEVPGHTPGSMAYLDTKTGIFFSGDCGNDCTFLFLEGSTTVSQYHRSLKNLKMKYGEKIRRWFLFHGRTEVPTEILDELIECCETIMGGKETGDFFHFKFTALSSNTAKLAYLQDTEGKRVDGKTANIVFDINRR